MLDIGECAREWSPGDNVAKRVGWLCRALQSKA